MLEEIAEKLDFKYELYLTPDNNYGGKNLDGGWNGLVGEVYYGVCMPFYSLLQLHVDLYVRYLALNNLAFL